MVLVRRQFSKVLHRREVSDNHFRCDKVYDVIKTTKTHSDTGKGTIGSRKDSDG